MSRSRSKRPDTIHTSSKSNLWQTPNYFLEECRKVGPIAFDPATSITNPTKAMYFATRQGVFQQMPRSSKKVASGTGLSADWVDFYLRACGQLPPDITPIIFSNFPYGTAIMRFVLKLAQMRQRHGRESPPMLSITAVRSETEWFRTMWSTATHCLFWGSPSLGSRVRFVHPRRVKNKNSMGAPSAVFFWGEEGSPAEQRFVKTFEPHGLLLPCKHGRLPKDWDERLRQPVLLNPKHSVAVGAQGTTPAVSSARLVG